MEVALRALIAAILFNSLCIRAEEQPTRSDGTTLEAIPERDEQGRQYVRAASKPGKLNLPKDVFELVPSPDGKVVYGLLQGNPCIKVYSLPACNEIDEILVPRCPVSLWCDQKRLLVACDESHLIQIIDAEARKPLKTATVKDRSDLKPIRIAGPSTEGMTTLWEVDGNPYRPTCRDAFVYDMNFNGETRLFMTPWDGAKSNIQKFAIDWCLLTNNGPRLFTQCTTAEGARGVLRIFDLATGKCDNTLLKKLFGSENGFNRPFEHCFLSSDHKKLLLPTYKIDARNQQQWTYVATADLSSFVFDFPGAVIAEVPDLNAFISWRLTYIRPDGKPQVSTNNYTLDIFYVERTSGRIIRIIQSSMVNPAESVCFVPGCELFIFKYQDAHGNGKDFMALPCGPVKLVPPASGIAIGNDPPGSVHAGDRFSFTPEVVRASGAKAVFKLKQKPVGMTIDPEKGTLEWSPKDAHVGKWDVVLIAELDGKEVPVLSWALEVSP